MNHLSNSSTPLPSSMPATAAHGQARAARGPFPQHEPAWQPDGRPRFSQRGNGNAWRGVDTRRDRLSRAELVTRIRARVDASLLPAPAQPDAGPISTHLGSLCRTVSDGMRSLIASMPTLRIGPVGADAAQLPASAGDRPAADRISYFIKRFEKTFDIRKAATLTGNADLRGVTVVIGGDNDLSQDAMRVLAHLRRENGDRILMEGLSQANRWTKPTCDRFDAALRDSCAPIESGCAASASYYDAMMAYQGAVHETCAFILGSLSALHPDIAVDLPRNIDECLELSARHADLVASGQPTAMQRHAMRVAQASSHFKAVTRATMAPRQAHMLEQIRQPMTSGAARFVIVNTDLLADLAPQLLAEGKVILMMPVAIANSDARYRMPHPLRQAERQEL
jgi:hypothetical protein